MPKSKPHQKPDSSANDLMQNLDQFLFTSDERPLPAVSNKKNRVEARKKLDNLIAQDFIDQQLPRQHRLKPTISVTAITTEVLNSSAHIVDLRRQKAIKERGLDHLEQPVKKAKRPFFFQQPKQQPTGKSKIKYGGLDRQQIEESFAYREPELSSQPERSSIDWHVNAFSASIIFAGILLLIMVPIKTLWLAENLAKTKQNLLQQGQSAFSHIQAGLTAVNQSDFGQAKESFNLADGDFTSIKRDIQSYNSFLLGIAEALPQVGGEFKFANQLIEIGQNVSQAAALISAGADGQTTITEALQSLDERIGNVSIALKKAQANVDLIPVESIPEKYRTQFSDFKTNLPLLISELDRGRQVSNVSYQLLGGNNLSRILIVLQNNRELRPTGGFIGSYALVDFNQGKVSNFELPGAGSYDLTAGLKENIVPPYPLQLLSPNWNIWDSNWWPDFPTSAEKIAWFYQKSGGRTVDAVVSMNSDVIKNLLSIVGPIYLEKYQLTVNSQNFYDQIQQEVQVNYDKDLNKPKQILSDLAPLIIAKVIESPDRLKTAQLFLTALANKDIQIYSADKAVENKINDLQWSGAMAQNYDGDYLQVVNTNLGGGKSDGYIEESIDHRAEIQANGDIVVTSRITRTNNAPKADTLGYANNVDYLRVYVPGGSKLLSAGGFDQPDSSLFNKIPADYTGDSDLQRISGDTVIDNSSGTRVNEELGKTVFGNWMQIRPGESKTVFFKYRLPQKIKLSSNQGARFLNYWSKDYNEVDSYSFLAERQSGEHKVILNSSVVIDPQYKVVWSDSVNRSALSVNGNLVAYSQELATKQLYALLLANN